MAMAIFASVTVSIAAVTKGTFNSMLRENLVVSSTSKLLVYLEREPNAPFKYIRNVNQQKYERGAHNNGNKTRYKN